jgi:hypothetical protein
MLTSHAHLRRDRREGKRLGNPIHQKGAGGRDGIPEGIASLRGRDCRLIRANISALPFPSKAEIEYGVIGYAVYELPIPKKSRTSIKRCSS